MEAVLRNVMCSNINGLEMDLIDFITTLFCSLKFLGYTIGIL